MNKLTTVFLTAIFLFGVSGARAQSCCKKPTGNDMKAMALNKSFKAAHEAPLPLDYTAKKGSMVQFKVPGGPDGKAFYVPSDATTDKVLIIFHEWWGLNDYIKREAETWQHLLGDNVTVYAVDLYDGKIASTPDEAAKLAGSLDSKRGEAIINGLLEKIGKDKKIMTLGWCMGGSWSFTAAVSASRRAIGCVMYYGFPEKDDARINALKTDVLYIYGSKDNFIKKQDVNDFGNKIILKAHRGFTLQTYDAVHAFANPSNPKYDEKSAEDAKTLTVAFLKGKMSE